MTESELKVLCKKKTYDLCDCMHELPVSANEYM